MDFGKVLTRAGEIIWKHKVLWIFGILAGCGAQSNSFNYSRGGGDFGGPASGQPINPDMPFVLPPEFERAFSSPDGQAALLLVFAIFCFIFLLALLFFALGVYGRLGMIEGTRRAESGGEITFNSIHTALMPYLGRALGLNLIIGLAFLAVGIVFAIILVFGAAFTFGLGLICLIPLACLLVPLMWFVSVIVEQANVALVLEELSISDALRRGWEITRANLGESIAMGLILVIGGAVVGFIISIPLLFAFAPMMMGAMGFANGSEAAGFGGMGIALLCIVAYMPVLLLVNGIVQGYIKSAWTLTFVALRDKAALLPPEPPMSELPAA